MSRRLMALGLVVVIVAPAVAANVWAVNLRDTPNTMLKFPIGAPAETVLYNVSYDTYAMDFNSAATALFAITEPAPRQFGMIDMGTGVFTSMATISGLVGTDTVTGLKIDPTDETFYVSSAARLYTLNTSTGVLTPRAGTFPTGGLMIDIAIDKNGLMYGHDIGTDKLYSIDKLAGTATEIGATGYAANFAQGMDFDYDTNTLYATVYTGGGTGVFASFNLTTGAGNTIVSTTSWNAEMEMAIDAPIPEPASLLLLGLAGLLIRRR